MQIKTGDLDDQRVIDLLAYHFKVMRSTAPVESCHVFPLEAMRDPKLMFYTAFEGESLLGFGGVYRLDSAHGEVKSMHTAEAGRRKGVGQAILDHLIAVSHEAGLTRLSLETGAMDFFKPAHGLYLKNGFQFCEPFGDYVLDPNSVFMTRYI